MDHFIRAFFTVMFAASTFPSLSFAACAPLSTDLRNDLPAIQRYDCSFDRAAENDIEGYFQGLPPLDLGHNQVGQRLMKSEFQCGGEVEVLLVLDCFAGEGLAFSGTADPVFGKTSEALVGPIPMTLIANIQPPHGPIALGRGTSISELLAIANEYGIGTNSDLADIIIGQRSQNEINLWCGCEIFYPRLLEEN